MYQQKPFQSIDRLLKDQNGNKNLNSFHQPPKLELESETIGSSKIKVEIGSSKREVEVDSTMDQSNPVARKRQKLDVCAESSTRYKLLNMVSHGRISICGAVDLANSMVDDGMIHPAILQPWGLKTKILQTQNVICTAGYETFLDLDFSHIPYG